MSELATLEAEEAAVDAQYQSHLEGLFSTPSVTGAGAEPVEPATPASPASPATPVTPSVTPTPAVNLDDLDDEAYARQLVEGEKPPVTPEEQAKARQAFDAAAAAQAYEAAGALYTKTQAALDPIRAQLIDTGVPETIATAIVAQVKNQVDELYRQVLPVAGGAHANAVLEQEQAALRQGLTKLVGGDLKPLLEALAADAKDGTNPTYDVVFEKAAELKYKNYKSPEQVQALVTQARKAGRALGERVAASGQSVGRNLGTPPAAGSILTPEQYANLTPEEYDGEGGGTRAAEALAYERAAISAA